MAAEYRVPARPGRRAGVARAVRATLQPVWSRFQLARNTFPPTGNAFQPTGNAFQAARNTFRVAGNASQAAGNAFRPARNASNRPRAPPSPRSAIPNPRSAIRRPLAFGTLRHPARHIFDLTAADLRAWCDSVGLPGYRARQVHEWVYGKGVVDPALMTNLSARDWDLLADPERGIVFRSGTVAAHQKASDGTQKLLIGWEEPIADRGSGIADREDGDASGFRSSRAASGSIPTLPILNGKRAPAGTRRLETECVMIPYGEEVFAAMGKEPPGEVKERRTACISSQVGCPVGCKFCASGIGGLDGNLSAGRIVEQVWALQQLPGVGRISNVVFMGMGEPLSNFAAVTRAVRTLAAPPPHGMGISARKITISTVGLPKAIERLADELDLPVTLALSLHAPNDRVRRELIPWAEHTTIPELLAACQRWFDKTGREITLEYILLGGVNDRPADARELAGVAKTLRANVNLIRYNEVKGMPFARPDDEGVRAFQRVLREAGVNAHIRASRGRDISAACGQLRHESGKSEPVAPARG